MRGARPGTLPAEVCAVIGANLRVLRKHRKWTQAELGARMGWYPTTVCAAEGHRTGREGGPQRLFTGVEVARLADVLGVTAAELMAACGTCGGRPPGRLRCLSCGARGDAACAECAGSPPAGFACLCGAEGGAAA